jgi:hypothetical protein
MTETPTETEPVDPGEGPDDALAAMLAAGLEYAEAGERVSLSARTVRRRMSDPEFRRRVDDLKALAAQRAVALLTSNMSAAALELGRLLADGESEKTRLAAARAIIELGLKVRDQIDLEQRVQELERRAAEGVTKP